MDEEIKYIPYGTDEIDYNKFMQKAANEVQNYVNSQPWSLKRKLSFLSAYLDIMARGITGASNQNGIWSINYADKPIDLNSKSRRDLEMYGEAAYFIRQQMSSIPARIKEEEKKKEDLPLFDNEYFVGSLDTQIINNRFGGNKNTSTSLWNEFDKRDSTGLRGTTERARILADELDDYAKSLKEGEYNFEGSPFKDLNDLKSRLGTASLVLRSGNETDIKNTLTSIGLDYNKFFNNGMDDLSGKSLNGQELTYAQLAEYNKLLEEAKTAAQVLAKKDALKRAYDNTLFITRGSSKLQGKNPSELKNKYGADDKLRLALFLYSQLDIRRLSPDELSEIHGAYRFLAKDPIDNKLLKLLQSSSSGLYRNAAPNRFKKINGIDNLIWDSSAGQVIQILNRQQYNTNNNLPLDLFAGVKTQKDLNELLKKEQLEYLSNTNWTADLTRELMGIAADVASVIDPEPFSAGALALSGTGLRTYNRFNDKDGFTWTDAGHTALDAGLSLLGMIPVVGDTALAARVVGKLQKAAGWLGAAFAAASVPQAAKAAWNKVVNGLDMTVDDWRAIGNVLMGATLARRILLNRAAGNVVKNQGGGTKTEKVSEVEVKIGDKTEKVLLSGQEAKDLKLAYLKAGNSLEETTKALKNSRAVRRELEAKKTSNGKPAYTKEQLDAIEAPLAASGSVRGKSPFSSLRDTRGITTTTRTIQTLGTPITENSPLRVQFAAKNYGLFGRGNYGWNINRGLVDSRSWLRKAWDYAKNPYISLKPIETPKSTEVPKSETPKANTSKSTETSKPTLTYNDLVKLEYNALNVPNSKSSRLLNSGKHTGTLADGEKYNFEYISKDGKKIALVTNSSGVVQFRREVKNQSEAKESFTNFAKSINDKMKSNSSSSAYTRRFSREYLQSIKDLKKKGFFYRQGGIIQDNNIYEILKNIDL